ncbi:hypothetical protein C8Q72DRAFT_979574 [Fomitopsis betulina]|nr:hypothetical protein C8Q72DRAFT_979574 [Fomitopsis betulina]
MSFCSSSWTTFFGLSCHPSHQQRVTTRIGTPYNQQRVANSNPLVVERAHSGCTTALEHSSSLEKLDETFVQVANGLP